MAVQHEAMLVDCVCWQLATEKFIVIEVAIVLVANNRESMFAALVAQLVSIACGC